MQIGHGLYVAGDYILTELGETCEDRGLVPIGTETKCKSLESMFQNDYPTISYKNKHSRVSGRPKGCYAITTEYGFGIYFHETLKEDYDGANNNVRSVCNDMKGTTSKLHFSRKLFAFYLLVLRIRKLFNNNYSLQIPKCRLQENRILR